MAVFRTVAVSNSLDSHATYAALMAWPVVGHLDPADDGDGEVLASHPGLPVEQVCCSGAMNDSIATSFPADATRPTDPMIPCAFRMRWCRRERNLPPRLECTITVQPFGAGQ